VFVVLGVRVADLQVLDQLTKWRKVARAGEG